MKKAVCVSVVLLLLLLFGVAAYFGIRSSYPRPYQDTVAESGLDPFLVYAVVRAESGFDERAVSSAGAVGLMQLKPSTARFVCDREGLAYDESFLTNGAYNLKLGCLYLGYLLKRFPVVETALAAYNAGEGRVQSWLNDPACSKDRRTLTHIPYPETAGYLKKIRKFRKIYEFFY